jgi:hypothetical protein
VNPALAEVREELLALPDDAAHALDPGPARAPHDLPPGAPPPPPFVLPEHLAGKPDAALRGAQDAALAAGLTPEQASAAGRAAAEYVLAHGTSPETVHKRELLRGTEGGLPPDEVVRLAREAGDRAAAAREAARTQSPPAGESPRTPAPSTTPAGPPAAALSPRELKDLEKLAGGTAAGGALLKLLQEQGAVAGPGVSPFATPLPEVPVTAPGPGEGAGVAPVPAPGPAPGFPEPPETQESPGPGGVPWETLAGLAREAPSKEVPWRTVAGLGEGPAVPEGGQEQEPEVPAVQFAPMQRGGLGEAALSPFGGLAAEFWGKFLGAPGGAGFGGGGGEGGGEGGGGMIALLERIASSLDRLIDIVQAGGGNGFPGVNRGGQDFGGWDVPAYDDEDDGYTAASPSVHLDHLERPGKSRDASARPRKADRRSYHEEEGHP